MESIKDTEALLNSTLQLIASDLFDKGSEAMCKIKDGVQMAQNYPSVDSYTSVYSGMDVIVNRITPPHRDPGGCPTHFDLLVSLGTHTQANLLVKELGASLSYCPGTIICICGKVFAHEVQSWEGGERICVAHYMKDTVHSRLDVLQPRWPLRSDYPM